MARIIGAGWALIFLAAASALAIWYAWARRR